MIQAHDQRCELELRRTATHASWVIAHNGMSKKPPTANKLLGKPPAKGGSRSSPSEAEMVAASKRARDARYVESTIEVPDSSTLSTPTLDLSRYGLEGGTVNAED